LLGEFGDTPCRRYLPDDDPLVLFSRSEKHGFGFPAMPGAAAVPEPVAKTMRELRASRVYPLHVQGVLAGLLGLAGKDGGRDFPHGEPERFCGRVAMALKNARAFDLVRRSRIDFAEQLKTIALGTLSSGISHEIKNPLNHIKVGVGMLRLNKKHGVLDGLDRRAFEAEVFQTLEILDENAERANRVLERLARLARGPRRFEIEGVDLKCVLQEALAFAEENCRRSQARVTLSFPGEYPRIRADRRVMEDIFLHLLFYGRPRELDIAARVEAQALVLTVRDTAGPVPFAGLAKILESSGIGESTELSAEGEAREIAFGILFAREAVRRFGGRMSVSEGIGGGVVFEMTFPEEAWDR